MSAYPAAHQPKRGFIALSSLQAPLLRLKPLFQYVEEAAPVVGHIEKLEAAIDACQATIGVKELKGAALRQFKQVSSQLGHYADTGGLTYEEKLKRWCSLYIAGCALFWDVMARANKYKDLPEWKTLDGLVTELQEALEELFPEIGELGTKIYEGVEV